ncbi:hypothetical protein ACJX0J_038467, partial [Zea mays]
LYYMWHALDCLLGPYIYNLELLVVFIHNPDEENWNVVNCDLYKISWKESLQSITQIWLRDLKVQFGGAAATGTACAAFYTVLSFFEWVKNVTVGGGGGGGGGGEEYVCGVLAQRKVRLTDSLEIPVCPFILAIYQQYYWTSTLDVQLIPEYHD